MPIFRYVAIDPQGKKIRGSVTAINEDDLEYRLKALSLELVEARESKLGNLSFIESISTNDLIMFCIQLEQLDRAGVPILDSLADLRDSMDNPLLKRLLTEVHEDVKNGSVLSEALAKHPKVFNNVFTGLVAAGEQTGNLNEIFSHLAKHLKWVYDIQRKVKKAVYYPIFMMFVMAGVVSMMMLFVIPKLTGFLKAQRIELPFYTTALINTSEFIQNSWMYIVVTPILLFIVVKILGIFFDDVKYFLDRMKLAIPYMGKTMRQIELARFCRFFAITYRSGIGILDCLDIAGNIVKNRVICNSIFYARSGVSEGNSLTDSLRTTEQFPNLVLRMFQVGEDSGNLDMTLENVDFFYDREVNDAVNNMIGVIQPALTLILGGIMMWISIAVFGPLYSSFSQMNF